MTTLQLLAYISAALLLQAAVAVVIALRRWRAALAATPAGDAASAPAAPGAAPGAWAGWRDFRVAGRAFEDSACSQCSFTLEPVDGVPLAPFRPGQYLTFALQVDQPAAGGAGASVATQRLTRCYSLSDRPDPARFRITVKRALPPPGQPALPPGASSGHFHDRVHEGDLLQVRAPAGQFHIDADTAVPVVFIAGGVGITPMMSMLRWCLDEQPGRSLHLFYGVRAGADHAFKQVLTDLAQAHPAFRLDVVYSHPGPGDLLGRDYQHAGRIDLDLLRRSLPHGRHQFYVCGPPPMMASLVPALREWGVRAQDLHVEAFGPASVPVAKPAAHEPSATPALSWSVRFSRSGRTLAWDGRDDNLLDLAERHDLPVDSGCRSGNCGSCETRLVAGEVRYARQPDHAITPGHCLLCVGRPLTDLVLEA